ncbi:unnamed protein product [Arctogadus glacialis]
MTQDLSQFVLTNKLSPDLSRRIHRSNPIVQYGCSETRVKPEYTCSPLPPFTPAHTYTHINPHSYTPKHTHTHTHKHTLSYTQYCTHTHTHTDAHSQTHTHTHPLPALPSRIIQ